MKNNLDNSPFTVPDGFFRKVEARAQADATRIRTRRRVVFTGLVAIACAAVFFLWSGNGGDDGELYEDSLYDGMYNIDEMLTYYDSDIFLDTINY